jgi:hypothetical protein
MSQRNQPEKASDISNMFVLCPKPSETFEGKASSIKDSGSDGSEKSSKMKSESWGLSRNAGDKDSTRWMDTSLFVVRNMENLAKEMAEPGFKINETHNIVGDMEKEIKDLAQ